MTDEQMLVCGLVVASLKLVDPLVIELGVPPMLQAVRPALRDFMMGIGGGSWIDKPGLPAYKRALWSCAECGPAEAYKVRFWAQRVLVFGSQTRRSDGDWSRLVCAMADESTLPQALGDRLTDIAAEYREGVKWAAASVREAVSNLDTHQDTSLLHNVGLSLDGLEAMLALTVALNRFARAWNAKCADLEVEQLADLHRMASAPAVRQPTVEEPLSFPGAWSFDLMPFLLTAGPVDKGR